MIVNRQGVEMNETEADTIELENLSDKEKYNRKVQRETDAAAKRGGKFYPDPYTGK